jgi:type III secretion control protein HpaP
MHTSATHRAHVIAGPAPEHERAHAATPEMRRMAALFNAHRDAAQQGATPAQDAASGHEHPKERESEPARSPDNSAPAGLMGVHSQVGLATLPEPLVQQERGATGETPKDSENREGNESGDPPPSDPLPKHADRSPPAALNAALALALRVAAAAPGSGLATLSLHAAPATGVMPPPARAPQPNQPAQPARGRVEAAAAAQALGALTGATQPNQLVESIVSSVADFCSNPAVSSCSPWQITVPLDPALMPGCQLSLTLSHFDLTLRFTTTDTGSQQLILKHADSLRERLESLPSLQQGTPRRVAIIVI